MATMVLAVTTVLTVLAIWRPAAAGTMAVGTGTDIAAIPDSRIAGTGTRTAVGTIRPAGTVLGTAAAMLITPAELVTALDAGTALAVDARGRVAFLKGHVKQAIHLDGGCGGPLNRENGPVPCMLRPDNDIRRILAEKGIDPGRRVVIYGDTDSWGAEGRIFWLLTSLGYPHLAVLDGGFAAWAAADLPVGRVFGGAGESCAVERIPTGTVPHLNATDLAARIEAGRAIVIDTRTQEEFDGAVLYGETRGGRLPGARHLYWKKLLTADYRLKSRSELLARLAKAGIPAPADIESDTEVVALCTGGVRSGYVYFVLKYLGYGRATNYDNGFWEWTANESLPVEH
ncbi:MAG: sulfurtransferase [Deltaproteobacteria bacterium]|nr:sulfurtransferase [Candidatus Anaeroferrophillacea bacterium]